MFLIRVVFWLSIVVLLLPGDPEAGEDAPRVSALEAILAARDTVHDFSGFCARNPAVCETGSEAMNVMAGKAQYGARMLYGYLQSEGIAAPTEGTLTSEDMAEPWRVPVPLPVPAPAPPGESRA